MFRVWIEGLENIIYSMSKNDNLLQPFLWALPPCGIQKSKELILCYFCVFFGRDLPIRELGLSLRDQAVIKSLVYSDYTRRKNNFIKICLPSLPLPPHIYLPPLQKETGREEDGWVGQWIVPLAAGTRRDHASSRRTELGLQGPSTLQ